MDLVSWLYKNTVLVPVPALKLADCIEHELDIPVLFMDVERTWKEDGSISGAACHLAERGVILVNRGAAQLRLWPTSSFTPSPGRA